MPSQTTSRELLEFYDDFIEFQNLCMYLCDTVVALSIAEVLIDKRNMNELQVCAGQIKERAELLGKKLLILRDKSKDIQP